MMASDRADHLDTLLLRARGSHVPARGQATQKQKEKGRRRNAGLRPPAGSSGWAPYVVGGVLATLALVIAVALFGVGGGSDATPPHRTSGGPVPQGTETFTEASRSHVQGTVKYDRTPPAGGNHAAVWLNCGIYSEPVPDENAVHSLEHGAVWVTYQPGLSDDQVKTLRDLVTSKYDGPGRYVILSPYPDLPAPIVATAWGNQLKLDSPSDPRLGQFIDHFREGPQDLEKGAACTEGLGNPSG